MDKCVVAIPDLHFPYHNNPVLTKIIGVIKKIKPDVVISLGDLYDLYAFSKFPKALLMAPQDEVISARIIAEDMWEQIAKAAPKAERYQLRGNHDVRASKRLIEKAPELSIFYNDSAIFDFKGVTTIYDPRDELEIDGVLYTHGFLTKPGAHAMYYNKSVIFGHLHRAWVMFFNRHGDGGNGLFEVCSGYVGNDKSVPLGYTSTKFNQWSAGCTIKDSLGPRFIRL